MFWSRSNPIARRDTFDNQLDLFNRFLGGPGFQHSSFPAFNIWSDDDGAVITSELPGVDMQDLDITVSGNNITVKGSRSEGEAENGSQRVRRERPSGTFERSFELGFQIDAAKVEAKMANGVLEISLPRAENDKPRKIGVVAR